MNSSYMVKRLLGAAVTIALLVLLGSTIAEAGQSTGMITGIVIDPEGKMEPGVKVDLVEISTGGRIQEVEPEPDGAFVFRNVPFGSYSVRVVLESVVLMARAVSVQSSVPVAVELKLPPEKSTQTIVVSARSDADITAGGDRTVYTAETIEHLPTPSSNNAIERVLLSTPGVVPDEDGRMHVRGEDAQIQYVVDGIPITGNMTRIYSSLFDAGLIKSADVLTGALNAEYGVATAAVVDLHTKSGFDQPLLAHARALYGTFNTREAAVQLGGSLGNNVAGFFGFNSFASDRYLDPIASSSPNHSAGSAHHYFGKINAVLSSAMELTVLGGYNNTVYSIPNGSTRALAQNQVQNLEDYLVGARLNVELDQSLLSVLGYRRQARARITSGGMSQLKTQDDYNRAISENEKFFFGGDRLNTVTGGQVEWTAQTNWFDVPNTFKAGAGGEQYPLHEYFSFAVVNPNISDSNVSGGDSRYLPYDISRGGTPFLVNESRTGNNFFAYVQDNVRFGRWTINGGLRYDIFDLFEQESALSPRLNVGYELDEKWSVRASYNRIAMQAPIENLLVSSSAEALRLTGAEQGSTPAVVKSERSHVVEIGATYIADRYISVDFTGFGKFIDNFLVKVELGNSGVIFPANLKQGVAAGGELRLRLNSWNRLSGFLEVSSCISLGLRPEDKSSPVAAGLILGEEGHNYSHPFAKEDAFPTEHNQLLTSVLNLNYDHESGVFAGFEGRFDFGLPFDLLGTEGQGLDETDSRAELRRRGYSDDVIDLLFLEQEEPGSPDKRVAPHAILDLSAGYDFSRTMSVPLRLTASVLNVFDTAFLYKFESSFGGTHFGYPRMFNVKLETRI